MIDAPIEVLGLPARKKGMFTSKERLYLDHSGAVVKAGDPTRVRLLVGAGCEMPMAKAIELGLVKDADGNGEPDPENTVENKAILNSDTVAKPATKRAHKPRPLRFKLQSKTLLKRPRKPLLNSNAAQLDQPNARRS